MINVLTHRRKDGLEFKLEKRVPYNYPLYPLEFMEQEANRQQRIKGANKVSLKQVINDLLNDIKYYTRDSINKIDTEVIPVLNEDGNEYVYIRSDANATNTDDILELPEY